MEVLVHAAPNETTKNIYMRGEYLAQKPVGYIFFVEFA
jgi:hypothetical protein